ncbi:DUF6924 domain-containing protein [Promicromonospora sp. NFX87]|uniref:DUF6924 domain-containing protein n=1 Tax=Promicromonospora sp. NFX87 TaxID=3402691 RepID=UPI003AFAD91D
MRDVPAKVVPPVDELDLSGVLVRTDYTNDGRFQEVLTEARRPVGPNSDGASLLVVEDQRLAGTTPAEIAEMVEVEDFAFVVDARSMLDSTLLVVDLLSDSDTHLAMFRAVPETVYAIEASLVLANLDFIDLLESVGSDGVFRETFR